MIIPPHVNDGLECYLETFRICSIGMEKNCNLFYKNSFCENGNRIFENLFYENGMVLELLEVANNYVRAAYWNDHPKCEKCI